MLELGPNGNRSWHPFILACLEHDEAKALELVTGADGETDASIRPDVF